MAGRQPLHPRGRGLDGRAGPGLSHRWRPLLLCVPPRPPAVSPLEAASAALGGGRTGPALVIADLRLPSPLFALFPALASAYRAAPFALVFVLGLLQAQWTYTGYDASAHVAEETVMARLNSAWGVFLSVAVSAVVR